MSNIRDIFTDIFEAQPIDPTEAARRAVRPQLKRRFYHDVAVIDEADGAFALTVDDRRILTPAGTSLIVPAHVLADMLAAEWRRQQDFINPADMPLTRLSNTIIDGVDKACAQVAAEVVKYIRSDLLFYRAESPAALVARQGSHWDPVLAWARDVHGARFMLVEGVRFVEQPAPAIDAMAALVPADAWRLGAVHTVTTLTGSALIAIALAAGELTVEAAWTAAHVDEDWNMQTWGRDELALERRAFREAEMRAAGAVLSALQGRGG
jgi:chaperone required for assembly of F1-ATPase